MTGSARSSFQFTAPMMVAVGCVLALAAWSLPVNLKSISPALLREAGLGTPSVAQFGLQLVESEKIGPAALALDAAKAVQDPAAPALEKGLGALSAHTPEMVAWGG
ncbi:MAG TPA: hypothetical protein PLU52_01585, partial [Opitutaceae bacterium]|nr:hypothetical protein [Opitutaceae bacterium]